MEIKGFTYGYDGKCGDYRKDGAIKSQKLLFETGVNYMCLAFTINIKDAHSTDIHFKYGKSVTDLDLLKTIEHAHKNNVKVCLKPMVNCDDFTWRAYISFPDAGEGPEDKYWNEWFKNYGDFLNHYAELAEYTGCEMFCIGCEMCGTERKTSHWRKVIADIRSVYSGKLVYNTNHGHEKDVTWWSYVDYLGTSAYFPVGKYGLDKAGMLKGWAEVKKEIEEVHKKYNKPVCFVEIGCRSAHTCSTMPWDFSHKDLPLDEDEQAYFYDSCLETFENEPWFTGMFWWDWSTFIYDSKSEAMVNAGFNIHLKKAEQVLISHYSKL